MNDLTATDGSGRCLVQYALPGCDFETTEALEADGLIKREFTKTVSSTGRGNTPRWSALTVGAGAISPLRAKTLDTALVPSSGSGVIRQYWQLFQPSQRFAFSFGMNRVRACPSICMPFQRGGLE
jgi:hypothetical protein